MKRHSFIIIFSSLSLPLHAASQEFITNGDFETGDFSGWTVTCEGRGIWFTNDGLVSPDGSEFGFGSAITPICGSYDAFTNQPGPNKSILLQQTSTLPENISNATLRWSDRMFNYGYFDSTSQYFRVSLRERGTNTEYDIFKTMPGDDNFQEIPNNRDYDVTGIVQKLEGKQVEVVFELLSQQFYFNVYIDNVSLNIETVKTVSADIKPCSFQMYEFDAIQKKALPAAVAGVTVRHK